MAADLDRLKFCRPLTGLGRRNDNPMAGAMGCHRLSALRGCAERVAWRDVCVWAMPIENLRSEEAAVRI